MVRRSRSDPGSCGHAALHMRPKGRRVDVSTSEYFHVYVCVRVRVCSMQHAECTCERSTRSASSSLMPEAAGLKLDLGQATGGVDGK